MTIRYKLSPELADGQHNVVVDDLHDVIVAVTNWCYDVSRSAGERCSIETVEMSDEEVESLEYV